MSNSIDGGGEELERNANENSSEMGGANNEVISGVDNDDDNSNARYEYSYGDDPYEFNEEAFDLLAYNDEDVEWVEFSGWNQEQVDFLCSIDWERDKNVISNNTKLKTLSIEGDRGILGEMDDKRMQFVRSAGCFYHSIAGNRTLKNLTIGRSMLDTPETIKILSPFIENNSNLDHLVLGKLVLDSKSVTKLASAVSKSNLSTFGLDCCNGMTGKFMTQIMDAVGVIGIQNLYLDKYDMDDDVGIALGKSLCKNNTVKTLTLVGEIEYHPPTIVGSITPAGVAAIAISLANGSLEELHLDNNRIGPEGGEALARGMANNSTLRILKLGRSNIGGGIGLAEALEGNTTLEELDVSYALSLGQEDTLLWDMFFSPLRNCALCRFNLRGNTIGDVNIQTMVDSLNTMMSLTELNLHQTEISPSGWITFFDLMKTPGSVLERLIDLSITGGDLVTDEVLVSVASALVNNNSLQQLCFFGRDLTDVGWSALEHTLCNKTSIDTIYDSNHTLGYRGMIMMAPLTVTCLLKLNEGKDKEEVARQKIIQYYFLEDNDGNMHELMKMDMEMMPHVFGCFGRYDVVSQEGVRRRQTAKRVVVGLELIYRLVRGMPALFDPLAKARLLCKRV